MNLNSGNKVKENINAHIYPWLALIYENDRADFRHICTGTVLTKRLVRERIETKQKVYRLSLFRHILTAGSCTWFSGSSGKIELDKENIKVAVGVSNKNKMNFVDVSEITFHPEYNGDSNKYDAAIITLNKDLKISKEGKGNFDPV